MKINGKPIVYKYESIEKLLNDLLDSISDGKIYERGLIRNRSFRIPMNKESVQQFYEDLKKEDHRLFMSYGLAPNEFIAPHGMTIRIEEYEG